MTKIHDNIQMDYQQLLRYQTSFVTMDYTFFFWTSNLVLFHITGAALLQRTDTTTTMAYEQRVVFLWLGSLKKKRRQTWHWLWFIYCILDWVNFVNNKTWHVELIICLLQTKIDTDSSSDNADSSLPNFNFIKIFIRNFFLGFMF